MGYLYLWNLYTECRVSNNSLSLSASPGTNICFSPLFIFLETKIRTKSFADHAWNAKFEAEDIKCIICSDAAYWSQGIWSSFSFKFDIQNIYARRLICGVSRIGFSNQLWFDAQMIKWFLCLLLRIHSHHSIMLIIIYMTNIIPAYIIYD